MQQFHIEFRSVPSNQRSFAMGLQFLVVRVFGMLPGPIVVGNIYDNNCATWKYDLCGRKAFCAEYELNGISSGVRNVMAVCSCKLTFMNFFITNL